ncbi:MAG: hypothetical protein AAF481_10335 [Acidobacteriota bacterium]
MREEKAVTSPQEAMEDAMEIEGAIGVALVDFESGRSLGQTGGGDALNLEVASAGNTEVVRAKMETMANLGLEDAIEDILITLGRQYHIIRPLKTAPSLFLYLALERSKSNLAMARRQLASIERNLDL